MHDQIVIAGLGRFGTFLAQELAKAGYDVLAVDRRSEPVKELSDTVAEVVQGDATSVALWQDLPITNTAIGIVAFSSSIEGNVLTALLFRKLGFKRVLAKSESELHTDLLHAIGVEAVIEPAKECAMRLVHTLGSRILDFLEVTEDFGVAKIRATPALEGSTIRKLAEDKKVTVLVLHRGDRIVLQPKDDEKIKNGDMLITAGESRDLRQLAGGEA